MTSSTQQQHSHVPKFGTWEDNDNHIPYTTFFENARKDKSTGVIRMNPNDPEENPEAFAYANMAQQQNEVKTHVSSDTGGGSNKIGTPESGSDDKSNSDHCIKPAGAGPQRLKSDQKKGLTEGSMQSNSSSTAAGYSRRKSRSYASSNNNHHRTASVPKFGAWDETDPTSGDGYTVIFNKVKEERQSASANFPLVPSQPSQRKIRSSSSRSKVCCCLF